MLMYDDEQLTLLGIQCASEELVSTYAFKDVAYAFKKVEMHTFYYRVGIEQLE